MRKNNIKLNRITLFLILLFTFNHGFSQENNWFKKEGDKKKDPLVKVTVRKKGVYFGVQQGIQTIGELGGAFEYKRVKLKQPITLGATLGADYNLPENIMGFNAGVWRKAGRADFTYGAHLLLRTNFLSERIGLGPTIGYKIAVFHVQTGFTFLTNRDAFDTNELFIALRFSLLHQRKTTVERRKRDKSSEKK